MAFTTGQRVIAQLKGGQSGTKNVSPAFRGTVVGANGTEVVVDFDNNNVQVPETYFPGNVVNEQFLTLI